MKNNTLVLYIHGKGGTAEEAEHYTPLFPHCDVVGLDYKAETPWEAKTEFPAAVEALDVENLLPLLKEIVAQLKQRLLKEHQENKWNTIETDCYVFEMMTGQKIL